MLTRHALEDAVREIAGQTQRALELPGSSRARRCLLDHAAELRSLLADELDETTAAWITIPETALEHARSVWSDHRQ